MRGSGGWILAALTTTLWMSVVVSAAAQGPAERPPAPEPVPRISAEATPAQDRSLERRLRAIFSEIEGAEAIVVEVQAGVVELSGEVLSPGARDQAVKLARQVDGVVDVKDKTTLVRDFRRRLGAAAKQLRDLLFESMAYLPLLVVALVVFTAFWVVAFLLGRWEGLFRRFTANEFLVDFLRQLTRLTVIVIGLLVTFELLDATALLGTVLGAAGLIGLALGFALRATVENYIAGILLSMRQPFVHNDLVAIEGHEGHVIRLNARATIVMTLDGNHVRIPNATVFNGVVVNYTRNPERRFQFDVGVGVRESLSAAQKLAAETLVQMDGVLTDPPPRVDIHALGDSSVILRAFGWVDQRQFDFLKVRSEAIRLVKEAFDAAGVVMPEPSYTITTTSPAPPGTDGRARAPVGPRQAIDIARRTEIDRQIEEDRRATGEPDLLSADAPKE